MRDWGKSEGDDNRLSVGEVMKEGEEDGEAETTVDAADFEAAGMTADEEMTVTAETADIVTRTIVIAVDSKTTRIKTNQHNKCNNNNSLFQSNNNSSHNTFSYNHRIRPTSQWHPTKTSSKLYQHKVM